jgi:hypothetical protein
MSNNGKFIGGLLVGLGLAYLLDPERGANRRALVRDKATRVGTKLSEGVDEVARDLRNRASGAAAELRSRMKQGDVGDEKLQDREVLEFEGERDAHREAGAGTREPRS